VTRSWPVVGVLFGLLWVFLNGPPLVPDLVVGSLLVGLAVGVPVAYVFRRLYPDTVDLGRALRGFPYAMLYVLTFAREATVSSLDVTYRVLAPSRPIDPEVILIPLRVRTDLGVTTIANSITMTPGSLTLDYDPDENALYVHVIDGSDPEDIVEPIRDWEDYVLVILDEELSPGDPAPDFAVYPPDRTHPVLNRAVTGPGEGAEGETDAESPESREGVKGGTDTEPSDPENGTEGKSGAEASTGLPTEGETGGDDGGR